MANHGCIDGTLNGANYSSPMPLIGLYVAVASLLCMFFIIHDVVFGILARKPWLPSKFFGFNSATVTLLSVAVKLPVDLTTSMPSLQDQLSKLSGTVLICISMAFLMPSLGVNSDSERLTNMLGLSIFVITIAVNICIQIYTGVIVLFITEHIIILSFMLLLLVMLWYISYTFNGERKLTNGLLNNFFAAGDSNMFERLKFCHLYACSSDPQYKISVHPTNGSVSTISLICAVILLQATIRSLILKKLEFCQGKSDYKWTILPIVVIQVLTVIVGTVAIVYRWLTLFNHMDLGQTIVSILNDDELTKMRQTLGKELITRVRLLKLCASLFTRTVSIVQLLLVFPWVLIRKFFHLYKHDHLDDETLIPVSECMIQKGMDNLIRLKDQVYNRKSLTHLVQFLSQEHIQRANLINWNQVGTEYGRWCQRSNKQVCSLSIAFLVKIAQASIPNIYLESLLRAFNEANEIIHFVDKKTHFLRPESVQKAAYARDLWAGGDFTCLLPDDIIGACPSQGGLQDGVDHAIVKISKFKAILEPYRIYSEVPVIVDFINRKSYPTVDDLVKSIEQMFADMMHTLLSQLPIAIFIMLREGSADDGLEERVQYAMELIFQARTLDGLIYWSFPIAANITSFAYSDDDNVSGLPVAGPLTRLKNVSRNQNEETSV